MYDPTIGQFISEDPIMFEGLDPNLRRYVGNHPTYATDPTGLVELAIDGPHEIPITVHGHKWTIVVTGAATPLQLKMIEEATKYAIGQLLRAQKRMHEYKEKIICSASGISPFKDRETFEAVQRKLDAAIRNLKNHSTIPYNLISEESKTEGLLVTYFFPGTDIPTSPAMHVRPRFFGASADQQIRAIYHELGRFFGWLSGDGQSDPDSDIYFWDYIIQKLNEEHSWWYIQDFDCDNAPDYDTATEPE